MSYHDLQEKTFVVTGASSGMGRSTAILLAQPGTNLGLLDLYSSVQVADEIMQLGGQCIAIECNVQDTAVAQVVSPFGASHGRTAIVQLCIPAHFALADSHAFYIRCGKYGWYRWDTQDMHDWDSIVRTNLDGVKNCLRAQLRAIKGHGFIVNAASTAGQYGLPNCSPCVWEMDRHWPHQKCGQKVWQARDSCECSSPVSRIESCPP
jgi:3-oxoacyl-[acyl-carrier protein] reductase